MKNEIIQTIVNDNYDLVKFTHCNGRWTYMKQKINNLEANNNGS